MTLDDALISEMIGYAQSAKRLAYAPYSRFRVGACLRGESGKYYSGANVENVSYGLSNCAERTAVFKAVSDGEKEFSALALCSDSGGIIMPCGACRQVLAEFCKEDMPVICVSKTGEYKVFYMKELLPHGFSKEILSGGKN